VSEVQLSCSNKVYKLHKLYVLTSSQGYGAGRFMLDKILEDIKQRNGKTLILNVNRNNPALHFYLKLGFIISGEEDIDIGNGFFMNDYIMKKQLANG